jgi:hypothetical protein
MRGKVLWSFERRSVAALMIELCCSSKMVGVHNLLRALHRKDGTYGARRTWTTSNIARSRVLLCCWRRPESWGF